MLQTALWTPPSLCGCQFKITADFTDGSVVDGNSFRHPKPFSIIDIRLVNACEQHKQFAQVMPDVEHHYETDKFTGESYQHRGYLKHPIANPTPAQCLYEYFYKHKGQIHGLICGCQAHQHIDEHGVFTYLPHPLHTRKCLKHKGDTHDMQQAMVDHKAAEAEAKKGE